MPGPTPEDYRRYAVLCDEMARAVADPRERKMLENLATDWRRLANYNARDKRGHEVFILSRDSLE